MKTKIEIKSILGKVLFEYESEYNSVKQTLVEAVKNKADLQGADLRWADLQGADLRWADLRGADLRWADLQGADLRWADLQGADLRWAYLRGADLRWADLRWADLRWADLRWADLQGADLQGAYLQGAYLRWADLQGADLQGAKYADLLIAQTRILPEGDIIGWKKCSNNVIVKLLIPSNAKRSSAFGRKCRAEFAQVLEILGADIGVSQNDSNFIYKVGEVVKPDSFDENWMEECSNGIHFFITRIEAENY